MGRRCMAVGTPPPLRSWKGSEERPRVPQAHRTLGFLPRPASGRDRTCRGQRHDRQPHHHLRSPSAASPLSKGPQDSCLGSLFDSAVKSSHRTALHVAFFPRFWSRCRIITTVAPLATPEPTPRSPCRIEPELPTVEPTGLPVQALLCLARRTMSGSKKPDLAGEVALSLQSQRILAHPSTSTSVAGASAILKRQYKQMQTDKDIPGISVGLSRDSNIFEWEVMLMINDDVRYYGGLYIPPAPSSPVPCSCSLRGP